MKVLFDHNLPRRLREHLPVGIADLMKKGLINGWQTKGGKGIQLCVGKIMYPGCSRQKGASGKERRTEVALIFRGASLQKPIRLR